MINRLGHPRPELIMKLRGFCKTKERQRTEEQRNLWIKIKWLQIYIEISELDQFSLAEQIQFSIAIKIMLEKIFS